LNNGSIKPWASSGAMLPFVTACSASLTEPLLHVASASAIPSTRLGMRSPKRSPATLETAERGGVGTSTSASCSIASSTYSRSLPLVVLAISGRIKSNGRL